MLTGPGQLLQQHLTRPVGADEVGIGHPDHVDAVGGEPVHVAADFFKVVSAHRGLLGRTSGHLRDQGPGRRVAWGTSGRARRSQGPPGLCLMPNGRGDGRVPQEGGVKNLSIRIALDQTLAPVYLV
ncbi:two-component system, OmpR family, KDP operon response regulator KdpE [Streptomyces azureus]|uniref:Two-component system, OmpR family, KDP operon response regulator KdpE n=1 Tax=Streptomyces azureus TaxID=146537 RepID=A0A0K8PRN6_STRAJ|nr:two-component system, OmpR family, KDP operon response regulator KdpE [Streptomyces azureus]